MSRWRVKTRRGKLDVALAGNLWWRFASFVRPYAFLLVGAFFAALAAMAMSLAAPWPIQWVFDFVIGKHTPPAWLAGWLPSGDSAERAILAAACGVILLVGIGDAVFSHLRDIALADVGQRTVGKIRRTLFGHLQSLPPSVFERRRTGDLLMRLTGDIQMLRVMLVGAVVTLGQAGITTVAMVAA